MCKLPGDLRDLNGLDGGCNHDLGEGPQGGVLHVHRGVGGHTTLDTVEQAHA